MFFSVQTLTINGLLKTDVGEYRCSITNRAGSGESVSSYQLNVWCKYLPLACYQN